MDQREAVRAQVDVVMVAAEVGALARVEAAVKVLVKVREPSAVAPPEGAYLVLVVAMVEVVQEAMAAVVRAPVDLAVAVAGEAAVVAMEMEVGEVTVQVKAVVSTDLEGLQEVVPEEGAEVKVTVVVSVAAMARVMVKTVRAKHHSLADDSTDGAWLHLSSPGLIKHK